jgi:carboxypeptidase D
LGVNNEPQIAFLSTGDFVLGKNLAALGNLLDQGIKVALVYGDRDYQCNCEFPLLLVPAFIG